MMISSPLLIEIIKTSASTLQSIIIWETANRYYQQNLKSGLYLPSLFPWVFLQQPISISHHNQITFTLSRKGEVMLVSALSLESDRGMAMLHQGASAVDVVLVTTFAIGNAIALTVDGNFNICPLTPFGRSVLSSFASPREVCQR